MGSTRLTMKEANAIPMIAKVLEQEAKEQADRDTQENVLRLVVEFKNKVTELTATVDNLSMRYARLETARILQNDNKQVVNRPVTNKQVTTNTTKTKTRSSSRGFLLPLMIIREIVRILKRFG